MKCLNPALALLMLAVLPIWATESAQSDSQRGDAPVSFMLDWAVVCNMALGEGSGEGGAWDEFRELADIDHASAGFVAELWRAKAMMESSARRKELMEVYSEKLAKAKDFSETGKEKIREEFRHELMLLRRVCYFDNADKIKSMVALRLKLAKSGESTTLKAAKAKGP